MGIFGRMKEMASADLNHMLDRMEDPVPMAKHYIRQLEEQIDRTRHAVMKQLAAEQQYDMLIMKTAETVAKRSRQAELAVEREEENVAEIAMQDKLYHQRLLEAYECQRESIRQQAGALREQMGRLTDTHADLQNRLFFLVSRVNAAQALNAAASAAAVFDTERAASGFARMEDKLRHPEIGLNAGLSGSPGSGPGDKLDAFEEREAIKAELNRIKAARGRE
ncbi:PspA/IM30 family protein [Paenibacillus sp. DMB20]|uniref:PspA/IM30 family protein n=1 Tax=Paenibacillus sp. DMB20 TaxID=1642570 RepID=UPI000627EA1D|nr:PspA/IM30 family protein [Paenibacillus sp. DMB20]KKO54592.1 hypothetical protein XI25_05870 [Paenibacillus sp. DMB20]